MLGHVELRRSQDSNDRARPVAYGDFYDKICAQAEGACFVFALAHICLAHRQA